MRKLVTGLHNQVRLSVTIAKDRHVAATCTHKLACCQPHIVRLCRGWLSQPGTILYSAPCAFSVLFPCRAIQCLVLVSERLPGILMGMSCGTVSFPSGLPALTANSLLFYLQLNERRRSFCLPNSQIQLLGRKYSVFSLLEENLIRLIALFTQLVLFL